MEDFIKDSADIQKFKSAFFKLYRERRKEVERNVKRLKIGKPDPKSNKFGSYMISIYRQTEALQDEESSDPDFKNLGWDTISKLKPYL